MAGGSNPPSATNPSPLDRLAAALIRGTDALAVPADATIVLAVSGGPDSIAMLHAAARARQTDVRAWHLEVAHLDHGLRDASPDDAAFVTQAANALDIPLHIGRTDVAALARAEGRSIEDAGREARYRFFAEVGPTSALIATAHTADDAAETVIMNLMRGTGPTGVRGIPARRGRIIRPLLGERRSTLRALLDGAGIAYRIDASNEDPAFLRNRVRAEVMPILEEMRPGAVDRIGQFARHAADDEALLDEMAAAELSRRRSADGEIDWGEPPGPALGRRVLRLAIGSPAPNAERIEALLEAAEGARGGLRIELGGGRIASVRQRRIRFE